MTLRRTEKQIQREDRRQDEGWMSTMCVERREGVNPFCASEGRRTRQLVSVTAAAAGDVQAFALIPSTHSQLHRPARLLLGTQEAESNYVRYSNTLRTVF